MHRSALLLVLALVLSLSATAAAERGQPARPEHTAQAFGHADSRPVLPRAMTGRAALRALGDDLGTAAARNRMTTTELREVLSSDPAASLSASGKLAYADTFEPADGPVHAAAALVVPLAETFQLHSRLGSKHTIFLDFNGIDLGQTAWSSSNFVAHPIPANRSYSGFSLDGDPSTFNDAERTYVQEVYRIVASLYAAFDVDVTTAPTSAAAYERTTPQDDTYGTRVVFSNDPASNPICQPAAQCGGVAFVGTFNEIDQPGQSEYLEPAWVRFGSSAWPTALAAAHEIGHTLGLTHDGHTSPNEPYYDGHGAWAPIMGSGPGRAIQQFSKGEYSGASNKQDDFSVMASWGLPRIPDEAGNTNPTATTLGARTTFAIDGVITSAADADVYKIGPCTQTPTISASTEGAGSSLDLALTVSDGSGTQLAAVNPAPAGQTGTNPPTPTNTGISPFGPPLTSTYLVKVDGVGSGSPASTGYSDYGSIGRYRLQVDGCVAVNGNVPGKPTSPDLVHDKAQGTVSWTAPVLAGSSPITGYRITGLPSGPVEVASTSANVTVPGGVDLPLSIVAFSNAGVSDETRFTAHTSSWAPTAPPAVTVTTSVLTAKISWFAPSNPGGAVLTGWRFSENGSSTVLPIPQFQYGVNVSYGDYGSHHVTITPVMQSDDGKAAPGRSVSFVIAVKPSAPAIGTASSGKKGRPVTATARWTPRYNGGAAITSYKVIAYKLSAKGRIIGSKVSRALPGSARAYAFPLAKGKYKFRVVAYNVKGGSAASSYSRAVTAK